MLGGMAQWGWTVVGKKEEAAAKKGGEGESVQPVTVMGVRKKRKDGDATAAAEGVQTLDAGLVRKKVKLESAPAHAPASATGAEGANGVQILSAGLVRKKPKS